MKRDTQTQKQGTLTQGSDFNSEKVAVGESGDPGRVRTCNLPLRRGLLYPVEPRDHALLMPPKWHIRKPQALEKLKRGELIGPPLPPFNT